MSFVCVTGGAGFIGCHLVRELVKAGHRVRVIDNLKRASGESFRALFASDAVELLEVDIRHFDALKSALSGSDIIFHLAAQSNVMGALDDPDYSFTTNAMGTYHVLRGAVELGIRKVVFTSSREVYGDPTELPVSEHHPLVAKNPYGASKVAGEAYCRSFAQCHPVRVEIVRLANVYGPGDSGRVIPLWLRAANAGESLQVYGGEQVIDFVWVGTVVQALLFAAHTELDAPVNIGSGVGTSILELGRRIIEVAGSSSRLVRTPARGVEVAKFVADTRRMRALGLHPEDDPLAHLGEMASAYRG